MISPLLWTGSKGMSHWTNIASIDAMGSYVYEKSRIIFSTFFDSYYLSVSVKQ